MTTDQNARLSEASATQASSALRPSARSPDRVVLVIGGGGVIGGSIAQAFADGGARVVVADLEEAAAQRTAALIESTGGQAESVGVDITDEQLLTDVLAGVVTRHQTLDIAVNAAGIVRAHGSVAEAVEADVRELLTTNVLGMWVAMKHEARRMRELGGGTIVNISSTIGAHMVVPNLGVYGVSKAAVAALTKAMARECIADGIRINCVSPGPVDTPMSKLPSESDDDRRARVAAGVPAARLAHVSEVVSAVLWLASPDAAYTVGHDLVLDGGASL